MLGAIRLGRVSVCGESLFFRPLGTDGAERDGKRTGVAEGAGGAGPRVEGPGQDEVFLGAQWSDGDLRDGERERGMREKI